MSRSPRSASRLRKAASLLTLSFILLSLTSSKCDVSKAQQLGEDGAYLADSIDQSHSFGWDRQRQLKQVGAPLAPAKSESSSTENPPPNNAKKSEETQKKSESSADTKVDTKVDTTAQKSTPAAATKANSTPVTNTSSSSQQPKKEEPPKPKPKGASELYEHIQLNQYYGGRNRPDFSTIDARYRSIQYWEKWDQYDTSSFWTYYSLDVKEVLGDQFKITSSDHILNQLDDKVKLEVNQYKDLIIETLKVYEEGVFSDPDIYISLSDTAPTLSKNDVTCNFMGEDICMVSGKDIEEKNVTKITVGIFCIKECRFKFQAELDPELIMQPGKMHKFYFKENQQRIFKFEIPDSKDTTQVEIKGINENKFAQWEMMILQGNKVPSTGEALLLYPAWENGYIGHFEKYCQCFCTGCNYTVLVSAKSSGYVTLGAKTSHNQVDLRTFPGGETYDTVYKWGAQCYKYEVTEKDKDFRVRLQAFSGDPDAYVSPLVPINQYNYTRAKFTSKDHFWNEEMILEPKTREKYNGQTGMYYICVYGSTGSAYKISAKNQDHSIMLKAGLSESSYIEHDQVKQFYFTDNLLLDPKAQVKFSGHLMGGSVILMTKLCAKPADMKLLPKTCNFTQKEMLAYHPEQQVVNQEVGTQLETPDPNICSGSQQLDVLQKLNSKTEAHCIYVVGVIGIANYTSHFSVMVELIDPAGKNHPILLSEGVPQISDVAPSKPKFFLITIDDPKITKLRIQLTTIHGNPDLYVSSTNHEPTWYDNEKKSMNNGFYPDLVEFVKSDKHKIANNYYIGVYGDQMLSTFSLNYFTEEESGQVGYQKLLVGKKLKGIIHVNWDKITHVNTPVLDQPSLIFHFQVSSSLFKNDKEVQVRLNTEHGSFIFVVQELLIPESVSEENKGDLKPARFIGSDTQHVVIRADQLIALKQAKQEQQSGNNKVPQDFLIDFYARVYPFILAEDLYNTSIKLTEPYVFNIAFYDELKLQELTDGQPQRGVVRSQTFDYYSYFIDDLNQDYEISLQPISGGNSDLVFSLDPENKFPDKEDHTYISHNEFSTDSIVLTKKSLQAAKKKQTKGHESNSMEVFIGVYTKQPLSIYSLVVTKMIPFNPVKLQLGQIQPGTLMQYHNKNYYSVKASALQSVPIQVDLMPRNGNLQMELTVIQNYAVSPNKIHEQTAKPDMVKQIHGQYGSIIIDPTTDKWFSSKCEPSCLLIIAVRPQDLNYKTQQIYYKIQVSQEFQELIEGMKVDGIIQSLSGDQFDEHKIDRSRYKYFKFYKSCGAECDLILNVFPHGLRNKVLTVLINYQRPDVKSSIATKLPKWSKNTQWTISIKYGSQITIEGTEPYFTQNDQGGHINQPTLRGMPRIEVSAGYYYIGLHSFEDCSFSIEANVVKRTTVPQGKGSILDIQQLYHGRQDKPIYMMAGQTKYFYYKNWRNDDLTFKMEYLTRSIKTHENMKVRVGRLLPDLEKSSEDDEGSSAVVPVQFKKDLDLRWKPTRDTFPTTFQVNDEDFCMLCTYVIEVKNTYVLKDRKDKWRQNYNQPKRRKGDTIFRLVVEQFDTPSKSDSTNFKDETVFKGDLRLAEPRPIELDEGQTIFLVLKDDKPYDVVVDVEMLLGDAEITLYRYTDNKVFFEYPCPKNETHHIKDNIVKFNLSHELPKSNKFSDEELFPYALKITAKTKVFEAIAYLKRAGSLDLISDGRSKRLSYVFQDEKNPIKRGEKQTKVDYFIFLPTSHNLELQLNTQLTSFSSDQGTYRFDENDQTAITENGLGSMWNGLDRRFFSFKVGLKKIELANNLKGKNVKWTDELINDEQFDYVLKSESKSDDDKLFRMIEFEVDPTNDIILVRAEGTFDQAYAHKIENSEVTYSLKISSSEVNFLAPGEPTRAIVSDSEDRFKIFEFFVNKRQFPRQHSKNENRNQGMDLFIQMTPCTGLLQLYISDDYKTLFSDKSELQSYSAGTTTSLQLKHTPAESAGTGTIEIEHKRSAVRKFKKNLGPESLDIDLYQDDFGTQGKRIKNVNLLNHRKLYIGIKTLNEEEMDAILKKREDKEIQMMIEAHKAHFRRGQRKRQFSPLKSKFTHSQDMISTFEIKADFIKQGEPDELDKYRIGDFNYGIKFEVDGHGPFRHETFTWSPIEKLDVESYRFDQTNKFYKKMEKGVVYKLYLGYAEETIDMFSSLCQMEAHRDGVPLGPNRLRMLKKEDLPDQFLLDERDDDPQNRHKVLTVKDKNQVTVKGREFVKGLENAVVIAYIYDKDDIGESRGKPHIFSYAPVSFDKVFDPNNRFHHHFRMIFMILSIALTVACCVCIGFGTYYFLKKRAKQDVSKQASAPGGTDLQMRNMPYYDPRASPRHYNEQPTQSSMENEGSSRKSDSVGDLHNRTNTIEVQSSASSRDESQFQQNTQKVDSSDEDEK